MEIEPIINEISTDPITKAEIRTELRKIKNGKAGGKDEITLTYVPSKVFGRVLIERIRDGVNSNLRDEQAGFKSGRGTVEHIFILRNIIEL